MEAAAEKIDNYRFDGWSQKEDRMLSTFVIEGMAKKVKLEVIMLEVSKLIEGRTVNSCRLRWYRIRKEYL